MAHLFEHLMFAGSKNVSSFDVPLQAVGGDNNAFTNADITNYYTIVPSANVETAFWLESDRMKNLDINKRSLEVQKKVVVEEFNQRYLNQPYGDAWLKIRPIAYQKHPYRWATIGKNVEQIQSVTLTEVEDFYSRFYSPSNAILVVSGSIDYKRGRALAEKWFGDIQKKTHTEQLLTQEPVQEEYRQIQVRGRVPNEALYMVYHMPGRKEKAYYACDLLSDLLGNGKSSSLYQELVRKKEMMSSVSCYVTGNADPGLFVIEGKLKDGFSFQDIKDSISEEIEKLAKGNTRIDESLSKVKNMAESSVTFGNVELLNRSMSLAYASFLGNTGLVNEEVRHIQSVDVSDIVQQAGDVLKDDNVSVLEYHKK